MTYRIEATAERQVIHCLKCGGSSEKPRDVRLRNCPKCGYHSVFPPGMMGGKSLLAPAAPVGLILGSGEAVPDEGEESDQ